MERTAEVLVIGGGLGGVAAALAAARLGRAVILTEESGWLGGQLTSQAVPPDENRWMEQFGGTRTYRALRERIRGQYRRNYPLTDAAREEPRFDPGFGRVSRLCHEPRIAVAAIDEMLAPHRTSKRLEVLLEHVPVACETDGDRVVSVTVEDRRTGDRHVIAAPYILDATELGDLLELGVVEHVIGAEAQADTGELHARTDHAEPADQQAFSWCLAMDHVEGEDFTIAKPEQYDAWQAARSDFWPGSQLAWPDVNPISLKQRELRIFRDDTTAQGGIHTGTWWPFRRIASVQNFHPGTLVSDITLVNWPQLDYWYGPLLGVTDQEREAALESSRQLSLSFLYWMQTEAPRHDDGHGYPGLRPRGDLLGTLDELAMRPYIRESRRIRSEFTVTEQHVGIEARRAAGASDRSELFADSVGIGSYRIDLHPSTGGPEGPRTYVDIASHPFQIPLGALIPERVDNLLPANKNIGTTHITNGCYRLHPVEWNIGEAAGALAAYCLDKAVSPRTVRNTTDLLTDFQQLLESTLGVGLAWPDTVFTRP